MYWKSDDTVIDEIRNEVRSIDNELESISRVSKELRNLEEENNHQTQKRLKELDTISDYWQGPQADQYINQSIDAGKAYQKEFARENEYTLMDLETKAGHLVRKRENLNQEIEKIRNKEGINGG